MNELNSSYKSTNYDLLRNLRLGADISVETIIDRNNIFLHRRKWGTIVHVFNDPIPDNNGFYFLEYGQNSELLRDNLNWNKIDMGEEDPIFVSWRDLSRTKNFVFAAPVESDGAPLFRLLSYTELEDLPEPYEQVQVDWEQDDNGEVDFIKNKPTILNSLWEIRPPIFSGTITAGSIGYVQGGMGSISPDETIFAFYHTGASELVLVLRDDDLYKGTVTVKMQTLTFVLNYHSFKTWVLTTSNPFTEGIPLSLNIYYDSQIIPKDNKTSPVQKVDGAVPENRSITTRWSLTGGGDLSANRILNLVGDVFSPGVNKYYGTAAAGTRGYHNLPSFPTPIDDILDWDTNVYKPYTSKQASLVHFYNGTTNPNNQTRLNLDAMLAVSSLCVSGNENVLMYVTNPLNSSQYAEFLRANTAGGIGLGWRTSPGGSSLRTVFGTQIGFSGGGNIGCGFGYQTADQNSGEVDCAFGIFTANANKGNDINAYGGNASRGNSGNIVYAFGNAATQDNRKNNIVAFGKDSFYNNFGANSAGFGHYTGRRNNWNNVTQIGNRDSNLSTFILDTNSTKTFAHTNLDPATNLWTITGHNFGVNGEFVYLRFATNDTPPGGMSSNQINNFEIIDANTLKYTISSTGNGTFTLTKDVDRTNSSTLGYNAYATKVNQVVLGNNDVTEVFSNGVFKTNDGVVLKSPNNTWYKITIDNDGVLQVNAV